jgi:hypothetical protein
MQEMKEAKEEDRKREREGIERRRRELEDKA